MTTPQKYQYTPEPYERRDTLYELYWGKMLSMNELADKFDVAQRTIRKNMRENNVPRRTGRNFTRGEDWFKYPFHPFMSGTEMKLIDTSWTSAVRPEEKYPYDERDPGEVRWQPSEHYQSLKSEERVREWADVCSVNRQD